MKALRIILRQTSANYRKEETVENKMTYPLPPLSTVIGALHKACGYTKYHPMDISIQGNYESMRKEAYTDYCFLNSIMDDRGILVKMQNSSMLSNAFVKVAKALKSQGNSFRDNLTIQVYRSDLLKEYQDLKTLGDEIKQFKDKRLKPVLNTIKVRKKTLSGKKKQLDKQSEKYASVVKREKEIKELEKTIKQRMKEYELEHYINPISQFRSLTTSLKYYEVLQGIRLILHIKAEEMVLNDIEKNIYNLTAIGRSEDFVDVEDVDFIELNPDLELMEIQDSHYSAYVDIDLVRDSFVFTRDKGMRQCTGTKYKLNKNYEIINNQRIFNKKKVLYVSGHCIEEINSEQNLYFDEDGKYIVNFL